MRFKLYEKLLLTACGLSFVSDILLLPYSNYFCLITFTLLGISYISGAWFLFPVREGDETIQDNPPFTIASGLILGAMALAVVYRAYRWPGHLAVFYMSLILTIIIWMTSSFLRPRRLGLYYTSVFFRSALMMSLAFIIIFRHNNLKHKRHMERIHTIRQDSIKS